VNERAKYKIRPVLITRESLPQLRADLLNTNPERVESVKQLLEKWGLLMLPDALTFPGDIGFALGTDDVAASRRWINQLQRAVQQPDEYLPAIRRLLAQIGGSLSGTFRLRVGPYGLQPHVEGVGLLGALLMALPLWAKELPPRSCLGCQRMIAVPAPLQKYCNDRCGTRARVQRHRLKRRRRLMRRPDRKRARRR